MEMSPNPHEDIQPSDDEDTEEEESSEDVDDPEFTGRTMQHLNVHTDNETIRTLNLQDPIDRQSRMAKSSSNVFIERIVGACWHHPPPCGAKNNTIRSSKVNSIGTVRADCFGYNLLIYLNISKIFIY